MADGMIPNHRAAIIRLCAMVARFAGGRTGEEETEGEMLIEAAQAAKRAADETHAELARLRARVTALLDQNQAIAENVARMLPVYAAAVAWRRADIDPETKPGGRLLDDLADAADATMEKEQDDGK